ncbi:CBS domain-containing protein [Parendozoicomonas haliclonae]|uniref:Inosine 5'-monophosphate dehydrogenase n=1 Tax=Parendozoicomonas haliclonae TaxID=1960125 RepID=A0A1X7AF44_9GAMM|nr:CBS domain-containing protein [Parendozoicomonas haliclonae]SMA36125.1 inosine 5'-monophosphate dehydrogenase [Parendozoicomonas haliclonae]
MRSIKVQDCMTRAVVTVKPDMDIVEGLRILLRNDITAVPVLDNDGKLVGILSETDCLAGTLSGSYYSQESNVVSEFMARNVVTASPSDSIIDIYEKCMAKNAQRVPVLDETGKIEGMLSPKDLMAAVLEYYEKPVASAG